MNLGNQVSNPLTGQKKYWCALKKLINKSSSTIIPPLLVNGTFITDFKEKSKMEEGWINGGFFIIEPSFFDFIEGDDTYLEREPLARVAKEGELFAYKHEGFWQCMDTKRDRDNLEEIYKKGTPWIT